LSRKATKGTKGNSATAATQGRAYAFGWYCFLAVIALTPLVMGALPPQFGQLAAFRAFDPFTLPKTVTFLVLTGLSLASLCVSVLRREFELRWHTVMWVLVGLFGWACVSTMFSASRLESLVGTYHSDEGLVAILGYVAVAFLAIQYVRSTRDLRAVMATAVVSGVVVSAYAVLQYLGADPMMWVGDAGDRVTSTMGNPDHLGTYLVFPLALGIGLALSAPRGRARVGWWTAVVLVVLALVVAETRGAWIGALAVMLCIGFGILGDAWKGSRSSKVALGAISVAVVLGLAVAIVLVRPRMAGSSSDLWALLTQLSNGRTVIWVTGLRAWLTRPILGWGPDGFERAFGHAVGADWYALIEGLQSAKSAHNTFVQTLVALGLPGLVLTLWALVQTGIASFRRMRSAAGPAKLQLLGLWAALIGLAVALLFGVASPPAVVWLWLTVGLLLASVSHLVGTPPRPLLLVGAGLGVAVSLFAGSWIVADVIVGRAIQFPPGPVQVSEVEKAVRVAPLSPFYRWLLADTLVTQSIAEQRAGAPSPVYDATTVRALGAYEAAANANPGDPLVHTGYASVLTAYAARHADSGAGEKAIGVAREAVALAPRNPAALGALARAYEVSGRHDEAVATALLARDVAPEYSMQTLGSLLKGETTP